MTTEELSRLTGIDPLWVEITPCLSISTFQKSLAKQRSDGVSLDEVHVRLRDQLKSRPEMEEIVTSIYSTEYWAIDEQIRQRHDACVTGITGISHAQVDSCYAQHYEPFLHRLYGDDPQSAGFAGARQSYTACLKAFRARVAPNGNAKLDSR